MSYFDDLRKRASLALEPFEDPKDEVEATDSLTVSTADKPAAVDVSFDFPASGEKGTVAQQTYELPEIEFDNFDPFEVFGTTKTQADLAVRIASDTVDATQASLRVLDKRGVSDLGDSIPEMALGAISQVLPGTEVKSRVAGTLLGEPTDVNVGDITAYLFEPQETPPEVFEALSASVIDEDTPQAQEIKRQGRRAKKVRDADDIRTDAIVDIVEGQFLNQYGAEEGKQKYQELVDKFVSTISTPEKKRTERDGEHAIRLFVEGLMPNKNGDGSENQYRTIQRKASNLVLDASKAGPGRSIFNSALNPFIAYATREGTPEIDRAQIRSDFNQAISTGSTLERAEALEGLFNTPDSLEIEGIEPIETRLAVSQPIIEVIANQAFEFREKNTRQKPDVDDAYAPLKSDLITDEDEQNRVIYLSGRAGIPAPMAYAIAKTESTGRPEALAYNLHIGSSTDARTPENRRRTPEQELDLRQRLRSAGYDVRLDPVERDGQLVYPAENITDTRNNFVRAKDAFKISYDVNPIAAVQGAAWGEYQILGRDGGLIDLMMDIDGVDTEEQAAEQAVLQFEKNPSALGDELFVRWFRRDNDAGKTARKAANEGNVEELSSVYYGTSSDPDQIKQREKWSTRTKENLNDYLQGMFKAPEPVKGEKPVALVSGGTPLSERKEPEDFVEDLLTTKKFFDDRSEAEELLNMNAVQASSGSGLFASMTAFSQMAEYPMVGTAPRRQATERYRNLVTKGGKRLEDLKDSFRAPVGERYLRFSRSIYQDLLEQAEASGEEFDRKELEVESRKEAFLLMVSAQTDDATFPPFQTTWDYITGKSDELDYINALKPRVEVVGSVGGDFIYRQEGTGVAFANSLDALPFIGQSFNIGVAKHFLLPNIATEYEKYVNGEQGAMNLALNAGVSSLKASQMATSMIPGVSTVTGGLLDDVRRAGIRGVAERQNFVEIGIEEGGNLAAWTMQQAVDTEKGREVIDGLIASGMLPIPSELTGKGKQYLAAVDVARAAGSMLGAVPGFIAAVAHLDAISGGMAAYDAINAGMRQYRAIPAAERLSEALMGIRQEIYQNGVSRNMANANIVSSLETVVARDQGGESNVAVAEALAELDTYIDSLRRNDNLDGDFRQRGRASADVYIDNVAERIVGSLAQGESAQAASAKDAIDESLSAAVFVTLGKIAEKAAKSPEEAVRQDGVRLQELLAKGLTDKVTLTPKIADQKFAATDDALKEANIIFSTADRVEALVLGLKLNNPADDSAALRSRILQQRLARPRATVGNTPVEYFDVEFQRDSSLTKGLEYFGPTSEKQFEASLEGARLSDKKRSELRVLRNELEDFHKRFTAAVNDGSILDPMKRAAFQDEFSQKNFKNANHRLFSNSKESARGRRYAHMINGVLNESSVVTNTNDAQQFLERGLKAVLTYSQARAEATKAFARSLVDEDALRAAGISDVDDFLDPNGTRNYANRVLSALLVSSKEGILSAALSTPILRGFVDPTDLKVVSRSMLSTAEVNKLTADGQNPFSVASAVQGEVLRRLRQQKTIAIEQDKPDEVNRLSVTIDEVLSPEWRRGLINWMQSSADAIARGEDPEKFDLPVGISLGVASETALPVLPATKKFVRGAFFRAFGFGAPEERQAGRLSSATRTARPRISPEEERATEFILDRMFRYMARANAMMDPTSANSKVDNFIQQNILNIRSVDSVENVLQKIEQVRGVFMSTRDDISRRRHGLAYEELAEAASKSGKEDLIRAKVDVDSEAIAAVIPLMTENEAITLFARTYDEVEAIIAAARRGETGDDFVATRLFQDKEGDRAGRSRRRLARMVNPDEPISATEVEVLKRVDTDEAVDRVAKDMAERVNNDFERIADTAERAVVRYVNVLSDVEENPRLARRAENLLGKARDSVKRAYVAFAEGKQTKIPDLLIDIAAAARNDEKILTALAKNSEVHDVLKTLVPKARDPRTITEQDIRTVESAFENAGLSEVFDAKRITTYTGEPEDVTVRAPQSLAVGSDKAAPAAKAAPPVKLPTAPERSPKLEEILDDAEARTGIENLKSQVVAAALDLEGAYGRDAEVVLKAIDMIGPSRLSDIALVVAREPGPAGRRAMFDFTENTIRIYEDALRTGVFSDEVVKELLRSLTRYLPEDEIKALSDDYLNELALYQRNFPEQFDVGGNFIGNINDVEDSLRHLLDFEDWAVQTMKNLALSKARQEVLETTAEGLPAERALSAAGNKILQTLLNQVNALVEFLSNNAKDVKRIIENFYMEGVYNERLRDQGIELIVSTEDLLRRQSEWKAFIDEAVSPGEATVAAKIDAEVKPVVRNEGVEQLEDAVVDKTVQTIFDFEVTRLTGELEGVTEPLRAVFPDEAAAAKMLREATKDDLTRVLRSGVEQRLAELGVTATIGDRDATPAQLIKLFDDIRIRKQVKSEAALVDTGDDVIAEVQTKIKQLEDQASQAIGEDLERLTAALSDATEELNALVKARASFVNRSDAEFLLDQAIYTKSSSAIVDDIITRLSEGVTQGLSLKAMIGEDASPEVTSAARYLLSRQMKKAKRGSNLTMTVGDDGELYFRLSGDAPLFDADDKYIAALRKLSQKTEDKDPGVVVEGKAVADQARKDARNERQRRVRLERRAQEILESDDSVTNLDDAMTVAEERVVSNIPGAFDAAKRAQADGRELISLSTPVSTETGFVLFPGVNLATTALKQIDSLLETGFKRGRDRTRVLNFIFTTVEGLAPYVRIRLPDELSVIDETSKGRMRGGKVEELLREMRDSITSTMTPQESVIVESAVDQMRVEDLQDAIETKRASARTEPTPLPESPDEHTPLSIEEIERSALRTSEGDPVTAPTANNLDEAEGIDNIEESFLDMTLAEISDIATKRGVDLEDFRLETGKIDGYNLAKFLAKQDTDAILSQRVVADITDVARSPDAAAVQRADAAVASDEIEETAPQFSRDEAIVALNDLTESLTSGGVRRARERSVRVSRLIRESRDLKALTRQEIADRVFADLSFSDRQRVASSGAIDDLIEDIVGTVDKRIADISKEINKLRKQAQVAKEKSTTSVREETRRNYREATARYQRQADTMQEFLDDVLRKEKVDLAEEMGLALDEKAARQLSDEPVVPDVIADMGDPEVIDYKGVEQRVNRLDAEEAKRRPVETPEDPETAPTPRDPSVSATDARAMVYFTDDSSAIIYALKNADVSSGLHELTHVLRRHLRDNDLQTVLEWVNSQLRRTVVDGQPVEALPEVRLDRYGNFRGRADSVVTAEELFAEAHDQYLRNGISPTKSLSKVFKVMKELLGSIVKTLGIVPHRLEISKEMNDLFDSIYGTTRQLDMNDLPNVSRYYDTLGTLMGGPQTIRRAGRLESDLVIENELTANFRQRLISLQEYSSRIAPRRGRQYSAEQAATGVTTPGRVGARGLGTRGAEDYGPVTRRLLDVERGARIIGGEATEGDIILKKVLSAADIATVSAANLAVFLPYTLLYGTDAQMLLRAAPAAARPFLYGQGRELEEFTYGLTVLINDVSRRTGAARNRGLNDIISYLKGRPVYLVTGAERGTLTRGTFTDAEQAFFSTLDGYLSRVSSESQRMLYAEASAILSGRPTNTLALSGFWKGYAVKEGPEVSGPGLLLDDSYYDLVMPSVKKGDSIALDGPAQDLFGSLFEVIQNEPVGTNVNVADNAQKVAALLMFHAGKTTFDQKGVTVTVEMARQLSGEDTALGLLVRGAEFKFDGKTIRVPGLMDRNFTKSDQDAIRALLAIGVQGAASRIMSDAAEIGLGVTTSQYRSYARFVSGQQAKMSPSDIEEAEAVARKFGLSMDFAAINSRVGKFYVPRAALTNLRNSQKEAARLLSLTSGQDTLVDTGKRLLSWLFQVVNLEVIFGSLITRPVFRTASLLDTGVGAGSVAGATAAKASVARVGSASVLGFSLGIPGSELVSAERAADISDTIPRLLSKLRDISGQESTDAAIEGMKSKLRQAAGLRGDQLGRVITEAASAAKNRVEVLPILNNEREAIFVINGTPFRASDLRRIFVRNGLYNNGFKGVKEFLRANNPQGMNVSEKLKATSALSNDNAKAVDSMFDLLSSSPRRAYDAARGVSSTLFEHGLESMDAVSDFERTGLAVTFMEMGASPSLAAKMVVKAVYDYRGSVTAADRTFFKMGFMPFFSFQKNALEHFTDLLASPRGRFFARVAGRMPGMTLESLSTLYYETIVGPYGVNTTGMNEAEINLYYEAREFFELGLGDEVSTEQLEVYREVLPSEDKDISDEELMDYSFDGWTIRRGYDGYSNVPTDVRVMMRAMLLGRGQIRANGRYVKMSEAIFDADLKSQFAQMGATLAVTDEPSMAAFPAWAANRYPTFTASIPVLNESIEEMQRAGMNTSFGIMLPDNFVNAGFEQAAATLMTVYAGLFDFGPAVGRSIVGEATDAEVRVAAERFLNSLEPAVSIRDGSPTLKTIKGVIQPEDVYVELDPRIAMLLEGMLIPVQYEEGDEDFRFLENLMPATRAKLNNAMRMAVDPAGIRDVTFPFTESRPAIVVEEDGRRVVKYLDEDYEFVDEYEESLRRKPFLRGHHAILFRESLLGRINKAFLSQRRSPQEKALEAEDNLKNELMGLMLSLSRSAGLRVMGANPEMSARMSRVDPLIEDPLREQ